MDIKPKSKGALAFSRFRVEWAALALACGLFAAVDAYKLVRSHEHVVSEERHRLQAQAKVIEDNLVRQLRGADNALDSVREDALLPADERRRALSQQRLKALADAMPGVRGIGLIGPDGVVVASGAPEMLGQNLGAKEFYRVAKAQASGYVLQVSPPWLAPGKVIAVCLTKSIVGADGRFEGAVTLILEPGYFSTLARSVLYEPDMAVQLAHGVGGIFLTEPAGHVVAQQPQEAAANPELRDHLASGKPQTIYEGPSQAFGEERLMVLRTVVSPEVLVDQPFVVMASRSIKAVHARGRQELAEYGLFFVLLAATGAAALYFSQQRRAGATRAEEEQARLREENARRFEFGLQGADLGLWEWDVAAKRYSFSPRECDILGYAPNEVEPTEAFFESLVHPEDQARRRPTVESHMAGDATPTKTEYRVRHKNGSWVWVLSQAMVTERGADGRALRVLGTHLNISRRKRAEDMQREGAMRLELAMRAGNFGVKDWNVASGDIVLNARAKEILGWSDDDGRMDIETWVRLCHRDDQQWSFEVAMAMMRGEAPGLDIEYRIRRTDGRYVWVQLRSEAVEADAKGLPLRVVTTFHDIGPRKEVEARLVRAAELQQRTGELAKVGGWEFDLGTLAMAWTDEMYRIHELDRGYPVSHDTSLGFYAPQARLMVHEAMKEAMEHCTPWTLDVQMTTAKGRAIWVRTHGEAVLADGKVTRLVGAFQDITERIRFESELQDANEQLAALTVTDGLTRVGNRRLFDQTLVAEWLRCGRMQQPLALLMVDVDHFKRYNDHYGHHGGDDALRRVATLLGGCIKRSGELVARYGGEEFAVLLPGSDAAAAIAVAQLCVDRMLQAELPHAASPVGAFLSLSIGVATVVPDEAQAPSSLVRAADSALYAAKRNGRARWECASMMEPEPAQEAEAPA